MKKKVLAGLVVVAIAALTTFNVTANVQNNQLSTLMFNDLEALAAGESTCTSSSSENTGACKAKADGTGDACVEAGFWDSKNCYK